MVYVGYQGAARCGDGPTPGARAFMAWFLGAYGSRGGKNLGIFNCRNVRGGSTTSLHGEGRAVDFGHPIGADWVSALREQLRVRSAELGIQCIISERHIWSGSRPHDGWRRYTGTNPHNDHLHVELSWPAARTLTADRCQAVLVGAGPPAPPASTLLRVGSSGPRVAALQRVLNAWYPHLRLVVDERFGPATERGVRELQRRAGLAVDGIAGPNTLRTLGL